LSVPQLRKIYKQGNSLVVAIPPEYAQFCQLTNGDYVSWAFTPAGELLLKPATRSGPLTTDRKDLPGQVVLLVEKQDEKPAPLDPPPPIKPGPGAKGLKFTFAGKKNPKLQTAPQKSRKRGKQ
jgi:antitoxin component of MazEF toxin-antitoxin module